MYWNGSRDAVYIEKAASVRDDTGSQHGHFNYYYTCAAVYKVRAEPNWVIMVRPVYQYEVEEDARGPTAIRMRVITHGGRNATDEQRIAAMANVMRQGIINTIRQVRRDWTPDQVLDNVEGMLSATNIVNGQQMIAGGHMLVARRLGIGAFFGTLLLPCLTIGLLENIQESNQEIELTDLEWTFIFRPETFLGGAGRAVKPAWVGVHHYPQTWEVQVFDNKPIPCAAWAIIYTLNTPPPLPSRRLMTRMRLQAITLANRLGWGPFVTVANLEKFVRLREYKHLRISVVSRDFHSLLYHRAEGEDFVYDPEDLSNIIYLWLDFEHDHYAAAPAKRLQAMYRAALGDNGYFKFCHKCATGYKTNVLANEQVEGEERVTNSCMCDDTLGKVYKRQKVICKTCNQWGCGSECAKSCGYCRAKGIHRCIIYSDPDGKIAEFWTEDDGYPKNLTVAKPRLWVYDLEASISRTEVWGIDFERTANGAEFVVDEDNVPQVIEARYMKHSVNLVVVRCVFSGLEKVFEGPECMESFLQFILGVNCGKNICIAHNGSGYDTRHIMDAALRVTDLAEKMTPLSRGCKFMQLQIGKFFNIY